MSDTPSNSARTDLIGAVTLGMWFFNTEDKAKKTPFAKGKLCVKEMVKRDSGDPLETQIYVDVAIFGDQALALHEAMGDKTEDAVVDIHGARLASQVGEIYDKKEDKYVPLTNQFGGKVWMPYLVIDSNGGEIKLIDAGQVPEPKGDGNKGADDEAGNGRDRRGRDDSNSRSSSGSSSGRGSGRR